MVLEAGTRSAERRDNGDGLAEEDDCWDVSRGAKRSYLASGCASSGGVDRATTPRRDAVESNGQPSEEHKECLQPVLSPESAILNERLQESMVRTDELLTCVTTA